MKKLIVLFVVLAGFSGSASAQFLKNVLNSVKNTVQNRANDKASSTTNKAIDKVDGTGKKPAATAGASGTGTPAAAAPGGVGTTGAGSAGTGTPGGGATGGGDPASTKGYVRVKLSATKTLVGSKVMVSGRSVFYGSLKDVVMTVTGPVQSPPQTIPLKDSGSFSTVFVPTGPGQYRLTIKTSDGKAQQSVSLSAYPFVEMDSVTAPMRSEVLKAWDKLTTALQNARNSLSPNDAATIDQKVKTVTENKDDLLKFLDDISTAGKGLDQIEKQYGSLPDPVGTNLTKLGDIMSGQAEQMQQMNDPTAGSDGAAGSGAGTAASSHDSYDNTICEYLVMVSEACAAFSTITGFYGKCGDIIGNLVTNNVVSGTVGAGADAVGASDNQSTIGKEVAKLFSGSKTDDHFFGSKLSAAGLAGDLAQICSNILLKKYCAVMDGELQENYTCTYYNEYKTVWWQYKYTTGATISLRYPKGNSSGNIIKMKGNIEGNATKFSIYTNMDEQDEFRTASKGRSHTIPICVYAPPSVPFVSSKADKNTGFGAVARTMFTPACFNIPIDVDYDVDAHTMKFYVNTAIVDFSPAVQYIYCYLVIAAGIPLITRVDLPINDVKLTLGKAISMNSTFPVQADAENNLSVTAKGNAKVGSETSAVHVIDFSFSAKGQ